MASERVTPQRPRQPEDPPAALAARLGWKLLLAFAASGGVVALLILSQDGDSAMPPAWLLVVGASVVTLLTAVALVVELRWNLSLPTRVIGYAVAYNALVAAVKFGLAPAGLYEVNQTETFTLPPLPEQLVQLEPVWLTLVALPTFGLYLLVYGVLFTVTRRRLPRPPRVVRRGVWRTALAVGAVGLAAVIGSGVLAVVGGGDFAFGVVAVVATLLFTEGEYLTFVFTSAMSLLVGLALAGATALCGRAFSSVAERARVLGDATVLVSFFWLGLAFLALYHVLWVVYVLLLVTVWPLRTVVPK